MAEMEPKEGITNDFVGYEVLIDFMTDRAMYKLQGDIIEIGAFLGGGTVKLARFGKRYGKRVFAVDIFDPGCDKTRDTGGTRMCDIYQAFLQGRSQREIYGETTQGFDNIVTIDKDSKDVEFPEEQAFIFGFIDGNHDPDYVKNDFHLIWRHLVPGGTVGFHDYNFDLPDVTESVNRLIDEHRNEISEVREIEDKHIVMVSKRKYTAG
ncbi:MAG: class I SAM-dependent methyltransferase [Dehalococcoidia bacterium]|nr:MAG: class I SAM-dependent methyltransferase [Dehalococcoidia bacterium]